MDTHKIVDNDRREQYDMHKTSAYFRTVVTLHNLRDRAKDAVESWHERSLSDRLQDGWSSTRQTVASKTRNFFTHPENSPCKHIPEKYNYVFRSKSRWELVLLSGTVCGIEFCYAAETAFVTPILRSLGLDIKFVTMIWCLSPLIGLFLTPILGSMSDSCESKFGRRRPFIIMYAIGILLGLILVPNGHHIGLALGDKGPHQTNKPIVVILNGTSVTTDPGLKLNKNTDLISASQGTPNSAISNGLDGEGKYSSVGYIKKNLKFDKKSKDILQHNDPDSFRQLDYDDTFPNLRNLRVGKKMTTNLEYGSQEPQDEFSKMVDKEVRSLDYDHSDVAKNVNLKKFQNSKSQITENPSEFATIYIEADENLKTELSDSLQSTKKINLQQFDYEDVFPNLHHNNEVIYLKSNSGHLRGQLNANSENEHNVLKTKTSRQIDIQDTFPNLRNSYLNFQINTNPKDDLKYYKRKNITLYSQHRPQNENRKTSVQAESQNLETQYIQNDANQSTLPTLESSEVELNQSAEPSLHDSNKKFSRDIDREDIYAGFLFGRKSKRSILNSKENEIVTKDSPPFLTKKLGKENSYSSITNKVSFNRKHVKRSVEAKEQISPTFPSSTEITYHIQPFSIAFTVVGTVLLDFCSDACQSPSRTYLLDVCLPSDHAAGLSTFTVMAGLGGSIGYAMGAVHWETTFLGRSLGGQVNAVFMIVTIIFLICLVTTVCSFPEIPLCILRDPKIYKEYKEKFQIETAEEKGNEMDVLNNKPKRYGSTDKTVSMENVDKGPSDDEKASGSQIELQNQAEETVAQQLSHEDLYESIPDQYNSDKANISQSVEVNVVEEFGSSNEYPTLKEYLKSIVHMPRSLRILCLTNLFCWMSLVCYSLYFTDFVGECVYGGDPEAPEESPSHMLYQDGVQFGCWGMALYSISCSIYSLFIEALVKKIGAKSVYVGGQLVYSAGMVIMALARHKAAVILLSPAAGIMYSTLFTMPYLLIAHYHCTNKFSDDKMGSDSRVRGIGTDVAAVSSMVFLSQFILSLSMGSIVKAIGSSVVPVCAAAFLSACGALSATQVTYLDI